jgi:predicted dehydrogenase
MKTGLSVGIIGCGLIGQKRARAHPLCHVVACADLLEERAQALARLFPDAIATRNWQDVISHPDIEGVLIATPHNVLSTITLAAVDRGKHVLVEKPVGFRPRDLDPIIASMEKKGLCVKVGFNHRFHPAIWRAHEIVKSGALGPLYFIRGRYGHGGRIGYEEEWRAQPQISGGGELIDQGIHLVDLSRWFLGDFTEIFGFAPTYFWNMKVEDNAFLFLKTPRNQVAWLHASWTEWKNLFSFEIVGEYGKLEVEGLGGSYGTERLIHYRMRPEMGPPETTIWEYPFPDESFRLEFEEFLSAIHEKRQPMGNLYDARAALAIIERVYGGSQ